MQARGLLVSAILLAVLAGGVYWSEKTKKPDDGSSPDTPKLITFKDDDASRIEIRKKDGDTTIIERAAGKPWRLVAPKPLNTDQEAVRSMVTSMNGLTWDRLVEDKPADLSAFGLQAPSTEVQLQAGSKAHKILIGDETPTSGAFFAKLDGDSRVFTLSGSTKSNLDKTSADLRDKRLLTFDSSKLLSVALTAKGPTVEFGKNSQNEWQIIKPQPLRADSFQIEELVRKLGEAQMDTATTADDAKRAESSFAFGTRVAVAKVTDSSGTQEIEVRKNGKDNSYYAKSSVLEGVHKVKSEVADALNKGLDDFRNKKLFDFGFADPNKIEVRNGSGSFSFTKSGEMWMAGGKQMDSVGVQSVLDKLRDLTATGFAPSGFATPAIDLMVASNEGKRVEKVAVAKSGGEYLAKRENELSIYQLSAASVDELLKAAADVKPQPPAPAAKK